MGELTVWKYHGTGNDFVMIEDLEDERPLRAELVAALCDRHRGIGADGVIRITRAEDGAAASFFMDHWNADGSVAEMCGNGIRCLAKLVFERRHTTDTEFGVDTRAGVKHLSLDTAGGVVRGVTVGMGRARLARRDVPMTGGDPDEPFLTEPFDVEGRTYKASAVSMGNPHLVLFVEEDPAQVDVHRIGPAVERDPRFPDKTNVEFVAIDADGGIRLRVWERGVGETMACGTGACAALVAANEAGLVARRAPVRYPGGELVVERTDQQLLLTGPAERVFEATVDDAWLGARGLR
ncbi:MAG TPA: diaminopimelate epimerase [Actinomycetota bacterium]|nr:diaminopimelate epimerase [Actinomycetota bacterium]